MKEEEIIQESIDYRYLKRTIIGLFIIILMFIFLLMGNNDSFLTIDDECQDKNPTATFYFDSSSNSWKIKHLKYCQKNISNAYKNFEGIITLSTNEKKKFLYNPKSPNNLEEYFSYVSFKINQEDLCKEKDLNFYINAYNMNNKKDIYQVNVIMSNCH